MKERLLLAGGGHSHALILLRWIMNPSLRPNALITLVSKNSGTFYSSMIPGLLAGIYNKDEALIDIRKLSGLANVIFVQDEIIGLDLIRNCLNLKNRSPLKFDKLSLNIGSKTKGIKNNSISELENSIFPIKPFESSFDWIEKQDKESLLESSAEFNILGAGLSGLEIALSLRKRWPKRKINLFIKSKKVRPAIKKIISLGEVNLFNHSEFKKGPCINCTGIQVPEWLEESGLPVDKNGRIFTTDTFQVEQYPHIFAVGDCGVIRELIRPYSGVWAVRAAKPLAINLERDNRKEKLFHWKPQKRALQILGANINSLGLTGWCFWGGMIIGPSQLFWKLKATLDINFIRKFQIDSNMRADFISAQPSMDCRGCGAKVEESVLKNSLSLAGLSELGNTPEDASLIDSVVNGDSVYQSLDGFPALVSDPWLNARITALHACSDLWASGISISSAQAFIEIPSAHSIVQETLLVDSLEGIKSALDPQGAKLIGGHTVESRSQSLSPISLDIKITLSVNGKLNSDQYFWDKGGIEPEDILFISRGIGTGVIFAAAMQGKVKPCDMDLIISHVNKSQFPIFQSLMRIQREYGNQRIVHAATDITGFGLLGHIGEMITSTNLKRLKKDLDPLMINLQTKSIPVLSGAMRLIEEGYYSSLAPSNRRSWRFLKDNGNYSPFINLVFEQIEQHKNQYNNLLELMVDPQTCGPMLIACNPKFREIIKRTGYWTEIGNASTKRN